MTHQKWCIVQLKSAAELTEEKHKIALDKAVLAAKAEKIDQFEEARRKYEEARDQMNAKKSEYEALINSKKG